MYAFGIFYDRGGEQTVNAQVNDDLVQELVDARAHGDDEYEEFVDALPDLPMNEWLARGSIINHIDKNKHIVLPITIHEEESSISYGRTTEEAKLTYVDSL